MLSQFQINYKSSDEAEEEKWSKQDQKSLKKEKKNTDYYADDSNSYDEGEGDDDIAHDDYSTEKLFLIESKIIHFYLLSCRQSGIPGRGGFFPVRKRGRR